MRQTLGRLRRRKMNTKHLSISLLSFLALLLLHRQAHAQPSTQGYPCSAKHSNFPCKTYVYYRATAPNFLDLAAIGDLFGVSRLMISKPSNLSSPSASLSPDQPLLVPITCNCNKNLSYSNITYEIKAGDTFYRISTINLQNLTTYQAVELANPTLVPTNLSIGVNVVFPVFCKCPNRTQMRNNTTKFLITYVVQPSDTLQSIAALFGSDWQSLVSLNGENAVQPSSTVFVPVAQIPELKQPSTSASPSPSPSPSLSLPSSTSHIRKGVVIGLIVGCGVLVILLSVLLVIVIWFWWGLLRRGKRGGGEVRSKEGEKKETRRVGVGSWIKENFMEDVWECMDKYNIFSIEEVREATSDFDVGSLIQGSVYKGKMRGEVYAIKRMKWNAYEELKILQKVNHSNLVKLDGFCVDPEDGSCYLVYEYADNGSLHSWLHGGNGESCNLDWKTRLQIATDVACGLQYIHEHATPSVVHKDIKSSNVLLDRNMRAKIANFGLARSGCNAITMHIVGTQGYLAPEYLTDGLVTTKLDVFAFGVVLLELVSGREAIDKEGKMLWMSVDKVFEGGEDDKEERLKAWMDQVLVEQDCSVDSVMNVMAVAVACLQKDASKRPNMVDVVYMLSHAGEFYLDGFAGHANGEA